MMIRTRRHVQRSIAVLVSCGTLALGACANMQGPGVAKTDSQATAATATPAAAPAATLVTRGPKKRIAIMRFDVKTNYGWSGVDLTAAEMLTTALFKTDQFVVIERNALEKVLQEQRLGLSGAVDPGTAAKLGQVLGVQALVTGAVTQLGQSETGGGSYSVGVRNTSFTAAVDIRVIDTSTAEILLADNGTGNVGTTGVRVGGVGAGGQADRDKLLGDALRKATEDVADKLVKRMRQVPWSGRIAQMTTLGIYVNAGADIGLEAGHNLEVSRPGQPIKDPVTGRILGVEETPVGQIQITDVKDSYAIAAPSRGSGFKIGDIVRLRGAKAL